MVIALFPSSIDPQPHLPVDILSSYVCLAGVYGCRNERILHPARKYATQIRLNEALETRTGLSKAAVGQRETSGERMIQW